MFNVHSYAQLFMYYLNWCAFRPHKIQNLRRRRLCFFPVLVLSVQQINNFHIILCAESPFECKNKSLPMHTNYYKYCWANQRLKMRLSKQLTAFHWRLDHRWICVFLTFNRIIVLHRHSLNNLSPEKSSVSMYNNVWMRHKPLTTGMAIVEKHVNVKRCWLFLFISGFVVLMFFWLTEKRARMKPVFFLFEANILQFFEILLSSTINAVIVVRLQNHTFTWVHHLQFLFE